MNELDDTLGRLATASVHVGLANIDDAVLAGLALRRSQIPASTIGLAAIAALTVGMASATLPSAPAEAASITPFGAPPALAPSTLLGSSR